MTDYTVADELAAAFAEARPIFAGAFHTDTYSLVRSVETSDNAGGSTTVDATVETGRCSLNVSPRQGGEALSGDRVTPMSLYTAELPINSVVTENDRLVIDGRMFAVTDVKKGGKLDLFTIVELEER